MKWWEGEDGAGNATAEFSLQRAHSSRPVTGAFWKAEGDESAPLVLMGHGASGNRYQAPISHLAQRFTAEAGCHVLSIDGPVHGLRQVGPGGREAFGEEARRAGFIDDMVADWRAALAAVAAQARIGDCAYFGLSMGSIFGIPLVAALGDVKAAVLGLLGTTHAGGPFAQRMLADAARIECPVLFLMQLEDELFPRDGYLTLFDALASGDKRIHANPGLHPEVPAREVDFAFRFLHSRIARIGVGP
jgi:dienelactone hydrolase